MTTGKQEWAPAQFTVTPKGGETFQISVSGRARWALECLIAARSKGCTPIDTPGPRWSHYVWVLRGEGIEITTIPEPHDGPFPGSHGRYILRDVVTRVPGEGDAA